MSDAKVMFFSGGPEPTPENVSSFSFQCPKHNRRCGDLLIAGRNPDLKRDGQGKNGGVPMWDFDGNILAPTFTPSIDCKGCWHGYIEKGRCVNTAHQDEREITK